jgi:DNA repair protein SbcD/Mre11
VVDADPGRPVRVDIVPLTAGRRLVDFDGTLAELRARAGQIGNAFVRAVISGDQPVLQLASAAHDAAPQATFVSVDPRHEAAQAAILDRSAADGDQPDLPELFRSYLATAEPPGAIADHVLATFADLLDDADSEEPSHLGEENQLEATLTGKPESGPAGGRMLRPPAAIGTTAKEQS